MDRDAERKSRECHSCQVVTKNYSLTSVKSTKLPEKPWQDLALDLLGPMPSGEHLAVLTDYFSPWVEVDIVRSTVSKEIIKCLDAQFTRHGIPKSLRTDNSPNLVSSQMKGYLTEMGITQKFTAPFWPRANGEVERQKNRLLLKAMKAYHVEKKDWKLELNKYLLAYRSTNHSTTGKSPAQLLYNRSMSIKLPDLVNLETEDFHQDTRDRDAERKQGTADYADKRNRPSQISSDLRSGDFVLLEKQRENKLSPAYEQDPYLVTERNGDQLHLQSPQGVAYKRSIGHVKKYQQPALLEASPEDESAPTEGTSALKRNHQLLRRINKARRHQSSRNHLSGGQEGSQKPLNT